MSKYEAMLEAEQQRHRLRMEAHAIRHQQAMELQRLRNQVAAKQRAEAESAQREKCAQIAKLNVQAQRALQESQVRVLQRDENGRISGFEPEDDDDALQLAEGLFAEIERLRNEH